MVMQRLSGQFSYLQAFTTLSPFAIFTTVLVVIVVACGGPDLAADPTVGPAVVNATVSASIPASMSSPDPVSDFIATLSTPEPLRANGMLEDVLRAGVRPEGILAYMDVVLATAPYLLITSMEIPGEMAGRPAILFYVWENAHRALEAAPPMPNLSVDQGSAYAPAGVKVLGDDDPHHRVSAIWFSLYNSAGNFLIDDETGRLDLIFESPNKLVIPNTSLSWQLPITDANGSPAPVIVVVGR